MDWAVVSPVNTSSLTSQNEVHSYVHQSVKSTTGKTYVCCSCGCIVIAEKHTLNITEHTRYISYNDKRENL